MENSKNKKIKNTKKTQTNKNQSKTINTKQTNKSKTAKTSKSQTKSKIFSQSDKTKEINMSTNNENEGKKLLKIILIITIIMIIFYGITLVATQKADDVKSEQTAQEETATTEIQYENIIIGTMLNYQGTYYVLIKDEEDNRLAEYESLIETIGSSEDAPTIYSANLTDAFNKQYLEKEENYYPENIEDFAVTGTTLVKIVDNKIDSVYDNYDAIKNKLSDLV